MTETSPLLLSGFYEFVSVAAPEELSEWARARTQEAQLLGTLLIAEEGVNGTLCGHAPAVRGFLGALAEQLGVAPIRTNENWCQQAPFARLRVRVRRELVTFRQGALNVAGLTGAHVRPEDWNELVSRDDVVLLDTRNDYEVRTGTFRGAHDPETEEFTQWPERALEQLGDQRDVRVAMFCTGGIRCEKASAFLRERGYERVYQLEGGILAYLDRIPREESLFDGECFVFDQRVTVDHDLAQGSFVLCEACGWPIALPATSDTPACEKCASSLPGDRCG